MLHFLASLELSLCPYSCWCCHLLDIWALLYLFQKSVNLSWDVSSCFNMALSKNRQVRLTCGVTCYQKIFNYCQAGSSAKGWDWLSSPSCYRELGGSWHGLPFEAQSTAQIFSAESTAACKEFEQRLAMVICHKLYNSIFQERLWVSILVHDSIRRWILWLFTSTICIPKHQIHATCGGIITPKQQHKKEMLSFNWIKTLFIFLQRNLATPPLTDSTEVPLLTSPSNVTPSMSTGGSADCSANCSAGSANSSAAGSANSSAAGSAGGSAACVGSSADGSNGSGSQGLPRYRRCRSSFDFTRLLPYCKVFIFSICFLQSPLLGSMLGLSRHRTSPLCFKRIPAETA